MKYTINDYQKVKSFLGDENNQKEFKDLLKKPLVKLVIAAIIIGIAVYLSRHVVKGLAHAVNGYKDLQVALKR